MIIVILLWIQTSAINLENLEKKYKSGLNYINQEKYLKAELELNEVDSLLTYIGIDSKSAELYYNTVMKLSRVKLLRADYHNAKEKLYKFSRKMKNYSFLGLNELAEIENRKGAVFWYLNNIDSASVYFLRANRLTKSKSMKGRTYNNIGLIQWKKFSYNRAVFYYKKALAYVEDPLSKADIYFNISNIYREKGKAEDANLNLNMALKIKEKHLGKEHYELAKILINLAYNNRMLNNYDLAWNFYKRALKIYQSDKNYQHNLGRLYGEISSYYYEKNSLDTAYLYIDTSIKSLKKNKVVDSLELALRISNKARILAKKGKLGIAKTTINQALKISRKLKNEYSVSNSLLIESFVLGKAGKFIASVRSANQALILEEPLKNELKDIERLSLKDLKINHRNFDLFCRFQEAYLALLKNKQIKEDRYLNILNKFIQYTMQFLRTFDASSPILHQIIRNDISDIKGMILKTSTKYHMNMENIYPYLYSLKQISYKESIRLKKTRTTQSLNKEAELKNKISLLESKLNNNDEIDPVLKEKYEDDIFFLKNDLSDLYKKNVISDQKLKKLSVIDLQKNLKKDQIILDYHLSEQGNILFYIDKYSFKTFDLGSGIQIASLTKSFLRNIKTLRPFKEEGNQLRSFFLGPFAKKEFEEKKVFILIDNELSRLPVDIIFKDINLVLALTYPKQKKTKAGSIKSLSFAPVFSDSNKKANLKDKKIYRSTFTSSGGLVPLYETEREVTFINKLFKSNNFLSKIYLNKDANEKNIKSINLQNFSHIHFATHGIINYEKPGLSGLILSQPEKKTSLDNGILFSDEIYHLNLSADLVVLSSCESALGKTVHGEGVLSLTRAFMYAGAKNIITSLWKVGDKVTRILMEKFYTNVFNGMTYSEALKRAKFEMKKNAVTSHPRNWAGFVLYGSDGSIN